MSICRIGPYRLDTDRKIVTLNGDPLRLGAKAVEVLIALVERPGEVVTKDEILARVWPEGFVEEANLSQNVYVLRRTFQEHWDEPTIATIHGRGYRFVAPVETVAGNQSAAPKRHAWSLAVIAAAVTLAAIAVAAFAKWHSTSGQTLSAKGRQYLAIACYDLNQRRILQSLDYFRLVIKTDPRSPVGDAGIAEAFALMPQYGLASAESARENAYDYASQALQLDSKSPQAIAVLGFLKIERANDPVVGIPDLRRAVALDPSDPLPREWLGESLLELGHIQQAQAQLEFEQRLDPVSPMGQRWLGSVYFMQRRYTDAIDHLRRAVDLYPRNEPALRLLAIAYVEQGNTTLAASSIDRIQTFCRCPEHIAALRAFVYAQHPSTRPQALVALQKAVQARDVPDFLNIAFDYIALGEYDRAVTWLHRVVFPDPREVSLLAVDPRLDPVKSDPRFSAWTHPTLPKSLTQSV